MSAPGGPAAPPLGPPSVLITRPQPAAAAWARRLALRGWAPLVCSLTELRIVIAQADLTGMDGLVFTSANAVRCAPLPPEARALPCWCVGPATAKAAREAGYSPRTGPGDAAALGALIAAETPGAALLHPRGRHGTGTLRAPLEAGGVSLRELVVYEMAQTPRLSSDARAALAEGGLTCASFWSPRAAAIFARLAEQAPALRKGLPAATAACISAAAARPLEGLGFGRILVAETPDATGMDAAVEAARGGAGG